MKGRFGADTPDQAPGEVSRSQRRRDALAVLDLARALMDASPRALDALQVDEELKTLIHASRRVTQQVARKRQTQYLAKQLRHDEEAVATIRRAFDSSDADRRRESARLHRVEHWRARLIAEGDPALEALVEIAPTVDRQALRLLIRQARQEAREERPPSAARRLFRMLAGLLPDADTS